MPRAIRRPPWLKMPAKDQWFEPSAAKSLGDRMYDQLTTWAAVH